MNCGNRSYRSSVRDVDIVNFSEINLSIHQVPVYDIECVLRSVPWHLRISDAFIETEERNVSTFVYTHRQSKSCQLDSSFIGIV